MSTQYEEQRNALVPRRAVVRVPPSPDLPNGEVIEMPRLTLRRSLLLSRWLDDVGQEEAVKQKLAELGKAFSNEEEENSLGGMAMVFTVNGIISQLPAEKVSELFTIITGKNPDFIDEFWEPGWGFEALKVAFQQQGFGKMFQAAPESGAAATAVEDTRPREGESPLPVTPEQPLNQTSTDYST
jgi:hypothetical protein